MAKTTAPLFSFSASGSLAKSLTYFPWKGIHAVRTWAKPANPDTGPQQTQRGYMTDIVGFWHTTGFTQDDVAAYNRLALTMPTPMSGFNAFCKRYIDGFVAALGGVFFHGIQLDTTTPGQIDITGTATLDPNSLDAKWGYSPTALVNTETLTNTVGAISGTISGLTAGQRVYVQLVNTQSMRVGLSGIFIATVT